MTDFEISAAVPLTETQRQPEDFTLGRLNHSFHACVNELAEDARAAISCGQVPVLLRIDDRLILSVGATSRVFEINGLHYHVLKALAHMPVLAYFHRVTRQGAADISEAVDEALKEAQDLLNWDSLGLGDLDDLKSTLHKLMTDEHSMEPDSDSYASVSALQKRCVTLAARDEVDRLCNAVRQICDALRPEQWNEVYIVVCGGTQPRYKQLSKNFFTRLLKEQNELPVKADHRVIYSENCQDLNDGKALVADRLVNERLAELFLNSPVDLNEDVLGDAGLAAIEAVFSQKRPPSAR